MPFIKTVFHHFIKFTPRMNTTLQEKKCFPLNRIEEFAKANAQWKEINSIYSDWISCGYNILVEFHTAHSYLSMRDGVSCSRTNKWKRRSVQEKNYQTGNKRLCYKFYTRSGNIFFLLSIISHSIHSLRDEKRWTCNRNLKHFSYLTKEWFFLTLTTFQIKWIYNWKFCLRMILPDRPIQKTTWKLNWRRIKRHVRNRRDHRHCRHHWTSMAIQTDKTQRRTHSTARQIIYQHLHHLKTQPPGSNNNRSPQSRYRILTVFRFVQ